MFYPQIGVVNISMMEFLGSSSMIKVGDIVIPPMANKPIAERYKAKVTGEKSFPVLPDFKMERHVYLEFMKKSIIYTDGYYPDGIWVKVDEYQHNLELETTDGKEV
jgi:hypothetical protein